MFGFNFVTEPWYTGKHSCSLVDLNIAGIASLFGDEMLRPEAAPQEVDNPAEVFTGRSSVALQWSGCCWSLRQRRRAQRFGTTRSSGEECRWDPHGREKPGYTFVRFAKYFVRFSKLITKHFIYHIR